MGADRYLDGKASRKGAKPLRTSAPQWRVSANFGASLARTSSSIKVLSLLKIRYFCAFSNGMQFALQSGGRGEVTDGEPKKGSQN